MEDYKLRDLRASHTLGWSQTLGSQLTSSSCQPVVDMTLSPVVLSTVQDIHTSVTVPYLLHLGRYEYCCGDVPT